MTEALQKFEEYKIATTTSDVLGSLAQECQAQGLKPSDLDRLKFPSSDDTEWRLPDITQESGFLRTREVVGVIVYQNDARSYWAESYEENPDQPPDCQSIDCHEGLFDGNTSWPASSGNSDGGEPTGDCHTCQYSEWGSDPKGEGQACKMSKNLFILQKDKLLPMVISIGPGNFKAARKFFMKLLTSDIKSSQVVVGLSLETGVSSGNVKFPRLKMRVIEVLSDDMQEIIHAYQVNIANGLQENAGK